MNVSEPGQRTLHALVQGDHITFLRDASGRVTRVKCYNHDGHLLLDCTLAVFPRLKNKGLVYSRQDRPYRISMARLKTVYPQVDNR